MIYNKEKKRVILEDMPILYAAVIQPTMTQFEEKSTYKILLDRDNAQIVELGKTLNDLEGRNSIEEYAGESEVISFTCNKAPVVKFLNKTSLEPGYIITRANVALRLTSTTWNDKKSAKAYLLGVEVLQTEETNPFDI